ncbi:MAG: FAD-binding protein [Fluviicola sp.]|nr:FAD-binding protein [Fluviicola sp.]
MAKTTQFQVTPEQAKDSDFLKRKIKKELHLKSDDFTFKWKRRSIDARNRNIKINCTFSVYFDGEKAEEPQLFVAKKELKGEIAIVGFGPAGIFAALRALEKGIKPIVFERGKDVRSRRRDLAILNKDSIVNPESNYCFGEGGAGTYSDGKLYTRSKKRGDVQRTLEWFVQFGADEDILVDAHPHIGTNKLPQIIVAMREAIIAHGGEVHFESKVTDFFSENGEITGLEINHSDKHNFNRVILATGHSARDIIELIDGKNWKLNAKPFALGVRVEHPQDLIDTIQYRGRLNDDFIPPASYSLVAQVNGRGVYSFCMCPGGIVAPCATDTEEVVTNGWSPSKRNNPFANSGIVVSISPEDFEDNSPLACLNFQKEVERKCWEAGGKNQKVPAQRLVDFVEGRKSKDLPKSSYQPGLASADLNEILPDIIAKNLKAAFITFGEKMKGFLTNEAVLHAPESRTSSPVQIPRDETMQHPDVKGLYPCAEGAGYAGGIISAAIDGMKCVDAGE